MGQMAQRPERRGRLMDILTDNEIDERTHYFVLLYEADRLRQQIENGDFNFDALSKAVARSHVRFLAERMDEIADENS
jgi:hypothetical protein